MSVKTEFEIRFIFDVSKPIPLEEREKLLELVERARELRLIKGYSTKDLDEAGKAIQRMPVAAHPEIAAGAPEALVAYREMMTRHNVEESQIIVAALKAAGSIKGAARLLGMHRESLRIKMTKYGIPLDEAFTPVTIATPRTDPDP